MSDREGRCISDEFQVVEFLEGEYFPLANGHFPVGDDPDAAREKAESYARDVKDTFPEGTDLAFAVYRVTTYEITTIQSG